MTTPIKLGYLESAIKIEHIDGRSVETVTTPSMWALAEEYADTLRAKGGQTEAWVLRKMNFAIHMQAARKEGLYPNGPITLPEIAAFLNVCEVTPLPAESPTPEDGAEDPTLAAQDENPEAASAI